MENFEFKSQICTTKEQSERLLALGLKKETADMCWVLADEDREGNKYSVEYMSIGQGEYQLLHPDWYIPAWSLHRLLEILYGGDCMIFFPNPYEVIIGEIENLIGRGTFNEDYLEEKL